MFFKNILLATSSFFKEAPKVDIIKDNSLAPTPDGAIDESKIVSYQVAIDDLLRAGRCEIFRLLISNIIFFMIPKIIFFF